MSTTTQRPGTTTPGADSTGVASQSTVAPSRHVGRIVTGLVAGLAVAAIGVGVAWDHASRSTTATTDLSAYAAGGSVYSEQVPTVSAPWTDAYGPGSAVHSEQVPSGTAPWTDGYAEGSAVHSEQVPEGPSAWTAAYGPEGPVYQEQVPTGSR